jgi:MFS family permease
LQPPRNFEVFTSGFSALAAAYAISLPALLVFRCTTMLGTCVEFVAAIAWLAELFPNPERRESVLGYTQASAAVGGLMVTVIYYFSVTYGEHLPGIRGGNEACSTTSVISRDDSRWRCS